MKDWEALRNAREHGHEIRHESWNWNLNEWARLCDGEWTYDTIEGGYTSTPHPLTVGSRPGPDGWESRPIKPELKDCPWCETNKHLEAGLGYVNCLKCGCRGPYSSNYCRESEERHGG